MNKTQKTDKKRNNILISGKELFARRGFSETIGNQGLYRLSAEKGKSAQELNATVKKIFLEGMIRKKEYKK